jgi:hypothetical protein
MKNAPVVYALLLAACGGPLAVTDETVPVPATFLLVEYDSRPLPAGVTGTLDLRADGTYRDAILSRGGSTVVDGQFFVAGDGIVMHAPQASVAAWRGGVLHGDDGRAWRKR